MTTTIEPTADEIERVSTALCEVYLAAGLNLDQLARAAILAMDRRAEVELRSREDYHADPVEQLAFELAAELEDAELSPNDYVTVNRNKLRQIARRVLDRRASPPAPAVAEPVYKAVERILDENSAWIARPSDEVTQRVALAATIAAHTILSSEAEPAPAVAVPEGCHALVQEAIDLLAERKYGSPARSPGHNARLKLEAALAAAPEPSVAGSEGRRDVMLDLMAALAAAISLLERYPKAKKAAPSDKMFGQMLIDYRASLNRARKYLAAAPEPPATRSYAEGIEAAAKWHDDEASFNREKALTGIPCDLRVGFDQIATRHERYAAYIRSLAQEPLPAPPAVAREEER